MRNVHARIPDFNSFTTDVGDKFHTLYESKLGSDGIIKLREAGREDIQAKINSFAEETDMAVILHKLQFGDTSVLSSKKPMYGDFTAFPKTYAEAFDLVYRSSDAFESLPVDVKQQFDNDVFKWFSAVGSDDWYSKMGIENPNSSNISSPSIEPILPNDPIIPSETM